MLSFENDYSEGAHEKLLQRLLETNRVQTPGYGNDPYSESAKEKIRRSLHCEAAEIYFLAGGTQTNSTIIAGMLDRFQGVVSAETGHVAMHEAGAVEYTGHKVLTIPSHDGKMKACELADYLERFWEDESHEHMVFPGMVYLSHPTEYGTLYTKAELSAIARICRQYDIPLFLDGARLGYGLAAHGTDITLPDLAELCDVFYIGGTKVGALCGEAVVFTHHNAPLHFINTIKQHGALLAKGRLCGVQFDTLFTDDLYMEISRHAIDMAMLLKEGLQKKGYPFFLDSPTNQQFIILPDEQLLKLQEKVRFSRWERADESHTVIRLATSWATREEDVLALLALL